MTEATLPLLPTWHRLLLELCGCGLKADGPAVALALCGAYYSLFDLINGGQTITAGSIAQKLQALGVDGVPALAALQSEVDEWSLATRSPSSSSSPSSPGTVSRVTFYRGLLDRYESVTQARVMAMHTAKRGACSGPGLVLITVGLPGFADTFFSLLQEEEEAAQKQQQQQQQHSSPHDTSGVFTCGGSATQRRCLEIDEPELLNFMHGFSGFTGCGLLSGKGVSGGGLVEPDIERMASFFPTDYNDAGIAQRRRVYIDAAHELAASTASFAGFLFVCSPTPSGTGLASSLQISLSEEYQGKVFGLRFTPTVAGTPSAILPAATAEAAATIAADPEAASAAAAAFGLQGVSLLHPSVAACVDTVLAIAQEVDVGELNVLFQCAGVAPSSDEVKSAAQWLQCYSRCWAQTGASVGTLSSPEHLSTHMLPYPRLHCFVPMLLPPTTDAAAGAAAVNACAVSAEAILSCTALGCGVRDVLKGSYPNPSMGPTSLIVYGPDLADCGKTVCKILKILNTSPLIRGADPEALAAAGKYDPWIPGGIHGGACWTGSGGAAGVAGVTSNHAVSAILKHLTAVNSCAVLCGAAEGYLSRHSGTSQMPAEDAVLLQEAAENLTDLQQEINGVWQITHHSVKSTLPHTMVWDRLAELMMPPDEDGDLPDDE